MNSNDTEAGEKTCVFLGKPCIQEKCEQWVKVKGLAAGPLGVGQVTEMWVCVFTAIAMSAGSRPSMSPSQGSMWPPPPGSG